MGERYDRVLELEKDEEQAEFLMDMLTLQLAEATIENVSNEEVLKVLSEAFDKCKEIVKEK